MSVPEIASLVRSSDHQAVVEQKPAVSSPVEAYMVWRSHLVLARYAEAHAIEPQFTPYFAPDLFMRGLVRAQRLVFLNREWNEARQELHLLKDHLPADNYLRGEFYFLLGYTYNLLERFRSAITYHELAENYYRLAGLEGHRAQALNNLCACYNHLNEDTLFAAAFAKLRSLNRDQAIYGVQIPYHRVNAAIFLDREDYPEALEEFMHCLRFAEKEGRYRDLGSALCMAAYLSLKVGNYFNLETIRKVYDPTQLQLQKEHRLVLEYYFAFSTTEYFNAATTEALMRGWESEEINSIHHLYLLDLLCERLAKSRDYGRLLEVASLGGETALKSGQGINLIDFRYYEAKARMRVGELDRAQRLLMIFEQDAIADGSHNRIEKARALKDELSLCRKTVYENAPAVDSAPNKKVLRLNPTLHHFSYDGLVVDLTAKPVLERCLLILSRQSEMISLSDFFALIYEIEFNPTLHERRLHSLIDRVRKLFSDSDVLLRREGKLGWNPRLTVEIVEGEVVDEVTDRKTKLLTVIRQAGQPLALREIEKRFPCSRRTLQFDLHELLANQLISVEGNSRNRKYFSQV